MSVSPSPSSTAPRRLLWSVLIILLMIAVMVALVWWRVLRPQALPTQAVTAESTAPRAIAAPDLANMGEQQLLAAARAAMRAQHLVAPTGDNAVAYYLQVLHKNPHNRAAADALREVFPFAAQAVEQTINAGDLDEAQRELDLLAQVDPANYTLTLLGSKLADRRRLALHGDAKGDDASRTAVAHEVKKALVLTAASPTRDTTVATAPAIPAAAQAVPPTPHAVAPAASKPVPVARIERQPPLLLREVRPYYPAAARRQRRQGWVEVSYTVGVNGHVDDARVVRAQPLHLFDHAALSAVEHWLFQPARINGKPVPAVVTSRVNFTLPR